MALPKPLAPRPIDVYTKSGALRSAIDDYHSDPSVDDALRIASLARDYANALERLVRIQEVAATAQAGLSEMVSTTAIRGVAPMP